MPRNGSVALICSRVFRACHRDPRAAQIKELLDNSYRQMCPPSMTRKDKKWVRDLKKKSPFGV
jgi:hypothetical protein